MKRLGVNLLGAALGLAAVASAMDSAHHGFLGGPWEVVAKQGLEGPGMRVPVTVTHEDQPQELDLSLDLAGGSLRLHVTGYLPDARRETQVVGDPRGGAVVRLTLTGPNLQQPELLLAAADPARRSVSSPVGALRLVQLEQLTSPRVLQTLTRVSAVGVLTVWLPDGTVAENVIRVGGKIDLPGGRTKVEVLGYLPHFTIDRATKEVRSGSNEPINPAVRIRLTTEDGVYEQWVWAKFPHTPHRPGDLPLRVRFVDYSLPKAGDGVLTVTPDNRLWLMARRGRRIRWEEMTPGGSFPFRDDRYRFALEELIPAGRIEQRWVNGRALLRRPALRARLEEGSRSEPVTLLLGQPVHLRREAGPVVFLFRRVQPETAGQPKP